MRKEGSAGIARVEAERAAGAPGFSSRPMPVVGGSFTAIAGRS